MPRFIRTISVLGLLILCFAGTTWLAAQARQGAGGPGGPPPARQEPKRSLRLDFPPLFFREDWKLDPNAPNVNNAEEPEQPITQGNVANPNLEVRVWGD